MEKQNWQHPWLKDIFGEGDLEQIKGIQIDSPISSVSQILGPPQDPTHYYLGYLVALEELVQATYYFSYPSGADIETSNVTQLEVIIGAFVDPDQERFEAAKKELFEALDKQYGIYSQPEFSDGLGEKFFWQTAGGKILIILFSDFSEGEEELKLRYILEPRKE